jgi:hypothetical protein
MSKVIIIFLILSVGMKITIIADERFNLDLEIKQQQNRMPSGTDSCKVYINEVVQLMEHTTISVSCVRYWN